LGTSARSEGGERGGGFNVRRMSSWLPITVTMLARAEQNQTGTNTAPASLARVT
jgi:hypothetical protein